MWTAACRLNRRAHSAAVDTEDLVQEAILRAYRGFDGFTPGTNCRAWLLTILYSVFVNRYHRQRREPEPRPAEELEAVSMSTVLELDWEGPLLEAVAAGEPALTEPVQVALDALPDGYRDAVLLVDVQELTYEEAAEALECPVGTIRSRLSRARRRLAAQLADHARCLGIGVGRGTT